jgi:hypothetical protein
MQIKMIIMLLICEIANQIDKSDEMPGNIYAARRQQPAAKPAPVPSPASGPPRSPTAWLADTLLFQILGARRQQLHQGPQVRREVHDPRLQDRPCTAVLTPVVSGTAGQSGSFLTSTPLRPANAPAKRGKLAAKTALKPLS